MNHSFPSDREIVLTRLVDAPRERVFAAWIGADVDRWWGPRGFTTTTSSRDVRPGGEWRFLMRHAQYGEFVNRIRYVEITAPERLVYDHDGGEEDTSGGFRTTVTMVDRGGRTELTMHTRFASAEACAQARSYNAVEGGFQTMERFVEALGVATDVA
jgi:uncharacterized protein YndB with AHSA1/START domain